MIFSIYTITLDGTLVILLELMNMLTTQRLADYNTRRAADQVFSMGMEVGAAKHIAAPISCLYATPGFEDHAAAYKLQPLSTFAGHCFPLKLIDISAMLKHSRRMLRIGS